jgi:hypothetical protein
MVKMKSSALTRLAVLDGESWTKQPNVEQLPVPVKIQPSYTETVYRKDFVTYFTTLAEQGGIEKLTLHFPAGIVYGMGVLANENPRGVTDMGFQSRITKFYVSSLVLLAMVLGVVIALAATNHMTIVELCITVMTLLAIMSATVFEWKGWGDRGR